MKRLGLTLISALTAAIISSTASADIIIYTGSLAGTDVCKNIAGSWKGNGEINIPKLKIKCSYKSDNAKITNLGDNAFQLSADLKKTSGICPDKSFDIEGTCSNGKIILKTDSADLSGDVTQNGNSANINGTVTFMLGSTKIVADVKDLNIHKK